MTTVGSEGPSAARLDRLLAFLDVDGGNPALLGDAADAAFAAGRLPLAADLLDRCAAIAPLPQHLRNLAGVVALAQERFAYAADQFERLRREGGDSPELRFNLAWALAMLERHAEAAELLDDVAIAVSPHGPALKVQALHHLGDLEAALAEGRALVERHPGDQALLGAMASLAMDADENDLARAYAERAPDNPQAQAALGMFALDAGDTERALRSFESALAQRPGTPRALIGKGLALLAKGEAGAGAEALEAGAASFRTHLGSWIAAGWAHLLAGDRDKAKAMFERSVETDGAFSEGHGGLAVLAFMAGDLAEAGRRCETALKLDRQSLGGTPARIMLLEANGDGEAASRIRNVALATPVGTSGKTLLQALADMNRKSTP
jgi:tetratricopeptide (TPR) repeat protein